MVIFYGKSTDLKFSLPTEIKQWKTRTSNTTTRSFLNTYKLFAELV